jgi:putative thioredoxin
MGGAGADLAQVLEAGDAALAESDFAAAMTHFQQAMGIDPASVGALAGVVRCLVGTGDLEGAAEIIEQLNDDYRNDPAMAQAIGALELAQKAAGSAGELDAARAAVNADAHDLDARQSLALALFAVGEHGEAMSHLLESIRIDKDWNEQAARLQLLEFFASLGAANPDVIASRRKLSTLLFS